MELFQVKTLEEVYRIIDPLYSHYSVKKELVYCTEAVGRVLAEDLVSSENIPSFRRSTVDGYAVVASDTTGASESIPAFLAYKGEVLMGKSTALSVQSGETVYVPTGGQIPEGANAVIMIEYTEDFAQDRAVYKPVRTKENVMDVGDDVAEGQILMKQGQVIKQQHIAVLSALGIPMIPVVKKPVVTVISTGDELVDLSEVPDATQIRDVNGPTLKVFLEASGCTVRTLLRLPDQPELIATVLQQALEVSDIILLSGGSSVGKMDHTPELINALGKPGVLVHGIAIKPGKPTILGYVNGTMLFGLPGQPASCMVAYMAVVEYLIRKHLLKVSSVAITINALSTFQYHSASGRTEFIMVRLKSRSGIYEAEYLPGKSGMVTLLSEAVGLVEIPMDKGGILPGQTLEVKLFEPIF